MSKIGVWRCECGSSGIESKFEGTALVMNCLGCGRPVRSPEFGGGMRVDTLARNVQGVSPVMTVREVAKLFKVKEKTVRALIRSGELEAKKVGRQWRIRRDAVEELL